MRIWLVVGFILSMTVMAFAATDIVGGIGQGFTGRWPLAGLIGSGTTPPVTCNGTIDLSTGCVQPMLGGL